MLLFSTILLFRIPIPLTNMIFILSSIPRKVPSLYFFLVVYELASAYLADIILFAITFFPVMEYVGTMIMRALDFYGG